MRDRSLHGQIRRIGRNNVITHNMPCRRAIPVRRRGRQVRPLLLPAQYQYSTAPFFESGSWRTAPCSRCPAGAARRVRALLRNPEVLREKVLAGIERERAEASLGSVEEETKHLHADLENAREERAGYVRLAARGRIGDAEFDGYLAENAERVAELEEALAALSSRREEARSLDRWAAMVDEYAADLADLADQPELPPVREHELVPADAGNPLVPTLVTPQTLRQRSDEEMRQARREAQRSGGERWRALYEMLGLKVTAHPDGTLVLEWSAGQRTLRPGEPDNPGFLTLGAGLDLPAPPHLLPASSDSQRYRQARLRWGRQGSARARSFPASGRSGRP